MTRPKTEAQQHWEAKSHKRPKLTPAQKRALVKAEEQRIADAVEANRQRLKAEYYERADGTTNSRGAR